MTAKIFKTDLEIQQDIERELAWDTRVAPTEIGIQVMHGLVTLTGTVDTWVKVKASQDAAHRVIGVLDVANELTVRHGPPSERTDTEIAAAVREALESQVATSQQNIKTTVAHGMVTLEGTVSAGDQRELAERAVEVLGGITRVVNKIVVDPIDPLNVDAARAAVEKALERHAAREAARIELRATDATVHVTGLVRTQQEKEAVLGAVRGTRGVRAVADDLVVQPYV
jgi:osmotically-inducible protein OsmY